MGCFPSHDTAPVNNDECLGDVNNEVVVNHNNDVVNGEQTVNGQPTAAATESMTTEVAAAAVAATTTTTNTESTPTTIDAIDVVTTLEPTVHQSPDPQPPLLKSTTDPSIMTTALEAATTTTTTTTTISQTPSISQNHPKSDTTVVDFLALPLPRRGYNNTNNNNNNNNSNITKKVSHFFNKLSPSVAHSSIAIVQQPKSPKSQKSLTTTEATTARAMRDHKEDDDDDDDMTYSKSSNKMMSDDNTSSNFLLQAMTEGGGEAIHHLRNIFATPISFAVHAVSRGIPLLQQPDPSQQQQPYSMPYYPKSESERNFLQTVLQHHYLFDSQSERSIQKLIDAFEICTIDMNDPNAIVVHDDSTNTRQYHVNIMEQGEEVIEKPTATNPISNAYFYVVYYGKCQFQVDDTIVGYANVGDAFGELALLYNGPRAATVTAILQEDVMVDATMRMLVEDDVDDNNNNDEKETAAGDNDGITAHHRPNVISASTVSDIASSVETGLDSIDHPMETSITGPPSFPDYTVVLFRVHQRSFRIILQQDDQDSNDITMNLLNQIPFLQNIPTDVKGNLAQVMVPFPFNKGDHLVQKGIMDCPWYVIERGTVLATNIEHGYQDFTFTEGQCFGERAIMSESPAICDVYAETAGVGFTVDHDIFKALIGNVLGADTNIISRQQDISKLKAISILSSATQADHRVLNYLSKQITDETFPVGAVICRIGEPLILLPSLYLIRKGVIRLEYADKEPVFIVMDAFFGEDQLRADMNHIDRNRKHVSLYTATVIEECTCGILKLRDCRNVIDTRRMGEDCNILPFDSLSLAREIDKAITMDDLSVHQMIGAGTFGQVFIVSRHQSDGTERAYALKVQSKYELSQSGQAKGVVREKNLMKSFHHPFVAKLLAAFQDEKCVYMVLNLLQGGELYSVMHNKKSNVLPEMSAKFYVACIAEALFYLHCSHSLVFRDLKPENVMIDDQGYAILIDFGFCKKISGKTYTTCGTPLYLAPEVILNRGHSWSVDYWSLGIMIYEMLVGHTPFYEHGMNKAELFQNIIRGKVYPPENVSPEVLNLLSGLLRRDPAKRLGSLIGNESDVIQHPWFSEIDRDRLFLKELDAPFIPKIKDPFDSSNFSSWKHVDDKRFRQYPALLPEEAVVFQNF